MNEQPYEVTARKYRPQSFEDVVGQEHVTRTLQNALRTGQIHHAYLFTGPRGTGKTTTARLLAKALNCRSTETMAAEPCGVCESCKAISRGLSVDVMEIDGASNNSVDQIRELRDTLAYASLEGRYKIYIIDEVHMLSPQAFNAMLKSLEEPPKHVVFVFATTEPGKVLPTIMSRVQRYDFRRIGVGAITKTLEDIAAKEGVKADPEALHLIARKADGALRDAESLFDQVRAFTAGETITVEETRAVLGVVDTDLLFELTRLSAEEDAQGALQFAARLAEQGSDPREFLLGYAEHLRHLVAVSVGGAEVLESLSENERKRYVEANDLFGLEDALRRLEYTSLQVERIRTSPQPWIALETAFLRLVTMDRSVDIRRLLDQIDGKGPLPAGGGGPNERKEKQQPRSAPAKKATAAVEAPAEGPSDGVSETRVDDAPAVDEPADESPAEDFDRSQTRLLRDAGPDYGELPPTAAYEEDLGEVVPVRGRDPGNGGAAGTFAEARAHWKDVLEEIHHRKVTLSVFLQEADLAGLEDNRLVLVFRGGNHNFHINMVTRHEQVIRDVTREVLGHGYGVKCVKAQGSDTGERADRPRESVNEQLLRRLCEQDPTVQRIVELFDARLEDEPGGRPS